MLVKIRLVLAAVCSAATLLIASPLSARDQVSFDSAVYPYSAFKIERAKRAGVVLAPKPVERITGFLARPAGKGLFPAVVLMHGCGGQWRWNDVWSERLVAWGYVVLDLDSFGPRGITEGVCIGGRPTLVAGPLTRALDAHGAKGFLSGLSFVDASRIAVIGMSHGGMSVLQAINDKTTRRIGVTPFGAAVALYPFCDSYIAPDAPLLVLIGELDNWTEVDNCRRFDAALGGDPDVTVEIYPGAHHVFDLEELDRTYRNQFILRYHPEAAEDAKSRIKAFLARHLWEGVADRCPPHSQLCYRNVTSVRDPW